MLVDLNIKDFANKVATAEPVVPAGGCVTALSGLMGVALLEMAVNSALGHSTGEKHEEFFQNAKSQLTKLHTELLACIDGDAIAYQGVLDAYKLPNDCPEQTQVRKANIQAAALSAIEIPLTIGEACLTALEPGISMLPKVKRGVLGDLKIGLLFLRTCVEASLAAARINLSLIYEADVVTSYQAKINELQTKFDTQAM
ncbi:MAG: Formiminotetrahydrofolate cyclodeaminase [Firmicutes bacterium]|nr:Formiminotetrahydrofolate cyclodeaminase [Bacillota bacterium]